MKRYQVGAATLDIAITLALGATVFCILWVGLITPLTHYAKASEIKNTVFEVTQAAKRYYGSDVIAQRCLTPTKPLNLAKLNAEHYLDSDINLQPQQYAVRYQLRTLYPPAPNAPWTRPSFITVDVTFADTAQLNAVSGFLAPTRSHGNTLQFESVLSGDITASWDNFNSDTGCLP